MFRECVEIINLKNFLQQFICLLILVKKIKNIFIYLDTLIYVISKKSSCTIFHMLFFFSFCSIVYYLLIVIISSPLIVDPEDLEALSLHVYTTQLINSPHLTLFLSKYRPYESLLYFRRQS